jgi:hypothetical protein
MSSLTMTMRHQLHLRESQGTITPMMTHQLGAATKVGIDLHLGQKPKLGGRYADNSLIYILYFVGSLYIHVSLFFSLLFSFLFLLSKTQKDQKYFRCFSLFVSLVFYLWFALLAIFSLLFEKSKNILLCLLFPFILISKIENPKKYLLFFFGFVKFVVEFSLPLLHWSLVFTLYYSIHTSEEQ